MSHTRRSPYEPEFNDGTKRDSRKDVEPKKPPPQQKKKAKKKAAKKKT